MSGPNRNSVDVLLVGSHARQSLLELKLSKLIELKAVTSIRESLTYIRSESFDLIFVEEALEDGSGIILAPAIKRANPECLSIFIAGENKWATVEAARNIGFNEVLSIDCTAGDLKNLISAKIARKSLGITERRSAPSKIYRLTVREREILLAISTGATNEEIALARHNSIATIKSHLTSIYRKLEVRNRTEAIALLHKG